MRKGKMTKMTRHCGILVLWAALGFAGCGDPGESLEVQSSKCEEGSGDENQNSASLFRQGEERSVKVSIVFNCIVDELCAYKLESKKKGVMDVLVAPCDARHMEIAKCMCTMKGTVRLPKTDDTSVRVFRHGVYRPGEKPDRRLMAELQF